MPVDPLATVINISTEMMTSEVGCVINMQKYFIHVSFLGVLKNVSIAVRIKEYFTKTCQIQDTNKKFWSCY